MFGTILLLLTHAESCLQALESQSKTQLRALEAGVAALQRQMPAAAGGTAVSPEAFEKMVSTTHAMQRSLEQLQSSRGTAGKPHCSVLPAPSLCSDSVSGARSTKVTSQL